MHRPREFLIQKVVNQPLAIDAAHTFESRANDLDGKMRFATIWRTCMARVQVRLVRDFDTQGLQAAGKFGANPVCHGHRIVLQFGWKPELAIPPNRCQRGSLPVQVRPAILGACARLTAYQLASHGHRTPESARFRAAAAAGEHRAPRSRENLGEYFWFCLDHVREYNKSWNYCRGMDETQIEREIRNDTVWRRPTWPLGPNPAAAQRRFEAEWRTHGFGFAGADEGSHNGAAGTEPGGTPEQEALRCMDLVPPVTLTQLKTRYKELVKQFHPDANGGDKAAEERLKDINDAYTTLRRFLTA